MIGSLFLVLLALGLGVAWVSAWPILGFWRLVIERLGKARLARFNIALLVVPFLLGLVAAVGAIWPSEGLLGELWACHCAPTGARAMHLCLTHPQASLPLLPIAAFVLVWLGWRPVRVVGSVIRSVLGARALLDSARGHDGSVRLAELGTRNAFTVGLSRPVVLADKEWWASLRPEEQRIVSEHERAHVECRDPLSYTVAQLFGGLVPQRVATPLVASWLNWAERRADECAAQEVGDPALVAQFLVRQVQISGQECSLVPSFRGGDLEARVVALLDVPKHPLRLSSDTGACLPLSAALGALVLLALCGFQIHGLIERLLHLFT